MNRIRLQQELQIRLLAAASLTMLVSATAYAQSGSRHMPSSGGTVLPQRYTPQHNQPMTQARSVPSTKLGLDGYCPVCILDAKKWMKGNPDIRATFDGMTYYFPSNEVKAKFTKNPSRYVPALNGDCIVCLAKGGKRVPGSVRHAATYRGRVYMFPSDGERQMFLTNPGSYAGADLAMNGDCIVCFAKMGKRVKGSPDFTVMHQGMRYQFPAAEQANMFTANPAQFLQSMPNAGTGTRPSGTSAGSGSRSQPPMSQTSYIKVQGKSGCAACGHGVHPVGAPNELGLAITSWDGKVVVIEDAHKNYPQIYQDRFKELRLMAEGSVIKQQGNVTWLKPTSLVAQ